MRILTLWKRIIALILAGSLLMTQPVSGQSTLQHAAKVQIKPSGDTTYVDTLRLWGGLQAGADGAVQVINQDGTLNITPTTVGPGSVTFAMWNSNGCSSSQVPSYNGSAWVCTSLGTLGGLAASDNAVITGNWRFSTNTVFGEATTPQQAIHVYKGSAQAGISIEKGDETERWDILANATGLQIQDATSGNNLITLKNNRMGVMNTNPASGYELDVGGDIKLSGNLSLGSYFENSLIPATNDLYNLGDLNRRWASAWISQINATLFVEETALLFGGYSIIGKNAGVFTAASGPADTTINLNKDLTTSSWIVIRAHDSSGSVTPKTEYITLLSKTGACTGSGATLVCEYNVTRDATGLHVTDPDWPDGVSFLWLGVQGDGRIEMYSYSGIPRIGVLRQGATANDATELLRLGGLDGMPGMSSTPGRYGIFIGETVDAFLKYQKQSSGAASGDDEKLIVRGTIQATAGEFGSNASNLVTVSSEGLDVGTGAVHGTKSNYASTTGGFWLGNDGGTARAYFGDATNYFKWTGTAVQIAGAISVISGDLGGWLVTTDNIKDTAGLVGLSRTVTGGDDIRFWAGHATPASAPFRVTETGVLTASSGTIGGWTLAATTLTGANVLLDSTGTIRAGTVGNARIDITNTPAMKWYNSSGAQIGQVDGSGVRAIPPSGGTSYAAQSAYAFTDATGGVNDLWGVYAHRNVGDTSRYLRSTASVYTAGHDARTYLEAICAGSCGSKSVYWQLTADTSQSTAILRADTVAFDGDVSIVAKDLFVSGNAVALGAGSSPLAQVTIFGNGSKYILNLEGGSTAVSGTVYGTNLGGTLTAAANGDTMYGTLIASTAAVGGYTGTTSYSLVVNAMTGAATNYAMWVTGYTLLSGTVNIDNDTLFVDSGSNEVGVLTSNPLAALHVNGQTQIRTTTSTDGYVGLYPGSSTPIGYVEWYKAGPTRIGYIGYSAGSYDGDDSLMMNLENGATFIVNGTQGILKKPADGFSLDVQTGFRVLGSTSGDVYTGAVTGNTIGFNYNTNADSAGWINWHGYQDGTTQFRDLYIGDGKATALIFVDGSAGTVDFNELTTTSAFYPFVSDNGIIRAKSDGVNATITCTAGSDVVMVIEYGIVTSVTGSGCS